MADPRRSGCPIAFALDVVGDRWAALIVRDMAIYGKSSFSEFAGSEEGIAESVLAKRLRDLEHQGVIEHLRQSGDGRRRHYRLTKKGEDLVPVLIALATWGAAHDPDTDADPAVFDRAAALLNKKGEG